MTEIKKLTQAEAEEIAEWEYPKDYCWTSVEHGTENEYFLLRENYRDNRYFALHESGNLCGFFAVNNLIRLEIAALSFTLRPSLCNTEKEAEFLKEIETFIADHYPEVRMINVITYSNAPHAAEVYEALGYTNHGPLASYGHDMQSYEQEGFNSDGTPDFKEEIRLVVLSKHLSRN